MSCLSVSVFNADNSLKPFVFQNPTQAINATVSLSNRVAVKERSSSTCHVNCNVILIQKPLCNTDLDLDPDPESNQFVSINIIRMQSVSIITLSMPSISIVLNLGPPDGVSKNQECCTENKDSIKKMPYSAV